MEVSVKLEFLSDRRTIFATFLDELSIALHRLGLSFEPKSGAIIRQGQVEIGRVRSSQLGESVSIEWRPRNWEPDPPIRMDVRLRATGKGTKLTIISKGLQGVLGGENDVLGWFC